MEAQPLELEVQVEVVEKPTGECDTQRFSSEVFKFSPSSVDEKKRTVTCIAADDSLVPRYDWRTDEEYDLQLDISEKSANLKRMNNGAPLCADHNTYSVRSVLGVVERCWVEGKKLMAEVRFSERPEADEVWQDVKAGILRHLSIGAWIHFKKDVTPEGSKRRKMLATSWEPFELSVVTVPAIAGAAFMSAQMPAQSHNGPNAQEDKMEQPIETAGAETRVDPAVIKAAAKAEAEQAVAAERARVSEISKMCAQFKIEPAQFLNAEQPLSVEQVRVKIMDQLAAASNDPKENPPTRPQVTFAWDETVNRRESAKAHLLLRFSPQQYGGNDAEGLAKPFRAHSLMDMAKTFLEFEGIKWRGLDASAIAMAALTRSDFPNILADVVNKTLRDGYGTMPQTFKPFCRQSTVSDFRAVSRVMLSGTPALLKVNENGEFEQGKLTDSKETYFIATYGRIINISRQTIINDDLNALTRIPMMFGQSAANLESDIVWALLTNNGTMADGTAVFHADHSNLGTAAAIGNTSMDEMYLSFSLQENLEGQPMGLEPQFLLIPTGKRMSTSQYLNPTAQYSTPTLANTIPDYMRSITPIAETRLQTASTTAWYGVVNPNIVDGIEYAYLEGNNGVYTEMQQGFAVDGVQMKARLDFGAGILDYRGLFKNAGA